MSLKYAVLGLLAESPKYGYEMKKQFEGALANAWSLSYGQLYPTLHALSAAGWVTRKTERGKRAAEKTIYAITDKGRKKLEEWLWKPVASAYKVKDEFTMRFLFFSKLPKEAVGDYLSSQLKRTILQRQGFQKAFETLKDGSDYYLTAIMRKGIVHLDAEIQWLREVIDQIGPR